MNISINAPSYRRPEGVDTLDYIPECRIWVCESEAKAYRKANPGVDIVEAPKGVQGNVCRIRNYILDQEYERGIDAVAIVDDDLRFFGYFEGGKHHKIQKGGVIPWIEFYTDLAVQWGVKLWGVNCNPDPKSYREHNPFSMKSFVGSPFTVHIHSPLRYDVRFPLKEDYDLTLQHLDAFRMVLRLNKFHYSVKQGGSGSGQVGGCAVYRNHAREIKQVLALQKKWGSKIVRFDLNERQTRSDKKRGKIDINPIIRVPIRGV